jgi:hypothetical protein
MFRGGQRKLAGKKLKKTGRKKVPAAVDDRKARDR